MKLTGLRLFHNHMTIEPVIEIFGQYNGKAINRLRQVVFEEFAKSDCYGMIFTYMWAFDQQADWNYIEYVKSIFEPYNTEFYYVELVAPLEIRLERNVTENRLQNKASKRDVEVSNQRLSIGLTMRIIIFCHRQKSKQIWAAPPKFDTLRQKNVDFYRSGSLSLPQHLLENLFETDGCKVPVVTFCDTSDLG